MNPEYKAALNRLLDALDASTEVRELARALVHRAVAAGLHDGWPIEKLAASAVFVAFRRAGNAHSLDEIAAVTDLNRTAIARAYQRLTRELDIELPPTDPHEFVSRFVASFAIGDIAEAMAHDIIDETVEAGLHSGVSPVGVAAGAVYLADRENLNRFTQEEIADVAGVTAVTLRHRYTEQAKLLDLDENDSLGPGRSKFLDSD